VDQPLWKPALFPDRDLTPAEERIFSLVAADAAVREHRSARHVYWYWADPARRERNRAACSARRHRLAQREIAQ